MKLLVSILPQVQLAKIINSLTSLSMGFPRIRGVIMIFSLSLMNTALKADEGFMYLAANSQFLKLGGVYVQETQNIRNRKLIHQFTKKEGAL